MSQPPVGSGETDAVRLAEDAGTTTTMTRLINTGSGFTSVETLPLCHQRRDLDELLVGAAIGIGVGVDQSSRVSLVTQVSF